MKIEQTRNIVFSLLVVIFAALVGGIAKRWMFWGHRMPLWGFAAIAIIFCSLAITLLVLTLKLKESGLRKWFFIVTGASAAAIPIFAILHNVVYGLFFQGKAGEDEAVFFILAVIVCPALFVIGMLGSIVLLISARLKKRLEC
jgi:uncharacterized membrane protein